jgi:hypothetical protein
MLPFTAHDFFRVFVQYNEGVWPAQILLNAVAIVATILAFQKGRRATRAIWVLLGMLWTWTGVLYHGVHFTSINPAAFGFAALFVLQGMLFASRSRNEEARFEFHKDAPGVIGGAFVAYALLVYPIVGYLIGHRYPATPTFGAPCPTTIFTFGLLLCARGRLPGYLLVIPTLWALVGATAIPSFGMIEDLVMPVAAGVAVVTHLWRIRHPAATSTLQMG